MAMQGILVIEDDKFFRDLVSKKLEKEGYEVWAASGSGEAFKLLEEKKPSLI
ncbi:MAG TPA: response regulator, partial [Candidatus Campbellbacteria bacterium]|nr:response regulator [Candidatus Campbellbacteria bacterium]